MKISAQVRNRAGSHDIEVKTEGTLHPLAIAPKASGQGSSVNGGELLLLALATCCCNDIYREAAKRGIKVDQVEVEVNGDFGPEGAPGRNLTYMVKVSAEASQEVIRALVEDTDRVVEIHNTLRGGTPVTLSGIEALAREKA